MLDIAYFKKQLQILVDHPERNTFLLAVSGGADSMVLAALFQKCQYSYQIAHVNYKLRGEDSELDQKTVSDFCEKNQVKFHLYQVSEIDKKPENSIQLWARELRYNFFKQIQGKENIKFLVTAHHLNDQLETFIINLSKAAGINGLSGIPANDNNIIRPFLEIPKEEINEFAKINDIQYREDLSNTKKDYLRNRIRLEVIPKLMETNTSFLKNFSKSIIHLNQTKDFVQKQIKDIENGLTTNNKDFKVFSKKKLTLESDFVKFEILKKYGFTKEEEIPKIFSSENGSQFFSAGYRLTVSYDELILQRKKEDGDYNLKEKIKSQKMILSDYSETPEKQISIHLGKAITDIEYINKSFNWEFDAAKISFPLQLRKVKAGDEFHPVGFSGKKKVSKFFRDEKISILAREKIWILVDNKDSILGVVPFRQDRKYAKNENTTKILKFFNEM